MATSRLLLAIAVVASFSKASAAVELPSILQSSDMFCRSEADFDEFLARGRLRPDSGTETCVRITAPIRVAVMSGEASRKSMVRVMAGLMAYTIGWTNGGLPIIR